MGLQVQLLCVSMGKGVSTKSGLPKPYEFSFVEYLVPATNFIQGDHNIQKSGFEVKQIAMINNEQLYKKIAAAKPLALVDLELSADPQNPAKNIVTDIKPVNLTASDSDQKPAAGFGSSAKG